MKYIGFSVSVLALAIGITAFFLDNTDLAMLAVLMSFFGPIPILVDMIKEL